MSTQNFGAHFSQQHLSNLQPFAKANEPFDLHAPPAQTGLATLPNGFYVTSQVCKTSYKNSADATKPDASSFTRDTTVHVSNVMTRVDPYLILAKTSKEEDGVVHHWVAHFVRGEVAPVLATYCLQRATSTDRPDKLKNFCVPPFHEVYSEKTRAIIVEYLNFASNVSLDLTPTERSEMIDAFKKGGTCTIPRSLADKPAYQEFVFIISFITAVATLSSQDRLGSLSATELMAQRHDIFQTKIISQFPLHFQAFNLLPYDVQLAQAQESENTKLFGITIPSTALPPVKAHFCRFLFRKEVLGARDYGADPLLSNHFDTIPAHIKDLVEGKAKAKEARQVRPRSEDPKSPATGRTPNNNATAKAKANNRSNRNNQTPIFQTPPPPPPLLAATNAGQGHPPARAVTHTNHPGGDHFPGESRVAWNALLDSIGRQTFDGKKFFALAKGKRLLPGQNGGALLEDKIRELIGQCPITATP